MATTRIIRTRVRHMATMVPGGLQAASSSARARGIAATTVVVLGTIDAGDMATLDTAITDPVLTDSTAAVGLVMAMVLHAAQSAVFPVADDGERSA